MQMIMNDHDMEIIWGNDARWVPKATVQVEANQWIQAFVENMWKMLRD